MWRNLNLKYLQKPSCCVAWRRSGFNTTVCISGLTADDDDDIVVRLSVDEILMIAGLPALFSLLMLSMPLELFDVEFSIWMWMDSVGNTAGWLSALLLPLTPLLALCCIEKKNERKLFFYLFNLLTRLYLSWGVFKVERKKNWMWCDIVLMTFFCY